MKIFVSWSGPISQQIAQEVRNWLPYVLQGVEPFITTADIDKGAKWQSEIVKELEESNFGIVCLTPQNLTSQWIAFEAGALAKHLDGRVATLLFNLMPNDLSLPLSMFQATVFNFDELRKLVGDVNDVLSPQLRRPDAQLDKMFERFWPDLNDAVALILQAADAAPPTPEPSRLESMAQEMMAMLRQQNAMLSSLIDTPTLRESALAKLYFQRGRSPITWSKSMKELLGSLDDEAIAELIMKHKPSPDPDQTSPGSE